MVDIAADEGWLATTLRIMHLVQMCIQGRWLSNPSILTLPCLTESHVAFLRDSLGSSSIARSMNISYISNLPELILLYQQDKKLVESELAEVIASQHLVKQVCTCIVFF